MPHSRFEWAGRIKAAEREYRSVRLAMDWLNAADPEEIHELTQARGWDDLAAADRYAADSNLDATYLIRMYSIFERAVSSYWRLLPGNALREADGGVRINEIGVFRHILSDTIREAQEVRIQRNRVVHQPFDQHAGWMVFEVARRGLMNFHSKLPESWG